MLVQAITDHTIDFQLAEKSLKVTRYVGGLLLLISDHPLGERLAALGRLRQPIWALYAVRDLGDRENKSYPQLLFRTCFLVGFASRQLQPLLEWRFFEYSGQVTRLSPFLVVYLCGTGALNPSSGLSLVDNVGEVVATVIGDTGLIPVFPGRDWIAAGAGLCSATAGLAIVVSKKRAQHEA